MKPKLMVVSYNPDVIRTEKRGDLRLVVDNTKTRSNNVEKAPEKDLSSGFLQFIPILVKIIKSS